MLNREQFLDRLAGTDWDVAVIGGGATGLGAAVDAASRGFKTVLLEQHDFAKGTSSRSTKLIHGGVRYLRQGNVSLVTESLHERSLLLRNAPGLVRPLEFIVPARSWTEQMYYAAGLKAYDLLAGRSELPGSRWLSKAQTLQRAATLDPSRLQGGVSYFDAQFDDARLTLALAQSLATQGGAALNYCPVQALLKRQERVCGVVAQDAETGRTYEVAARAVVNAAGMFSDAVRALDAAGAAPALQLSQGIHIVVDRSFLPGETAIIVPETDDGRVLFLIPWHGAVLIGTTDTPVSEASLEPVPQSQEIDYLLEHARRYLAAPPARSDIRSCFAGLRPLVKSSSQTSTARLSRDHVVQTSSSGLVTITGGKWTTYRKMGEDAVDAAIKASTLPLRASRTQTMKINAGAGSLAPGDEGPHLLARFPSVDDEFVRRAVRLEMARHVEDVLARRTRLLFVDAQQALAASVRVAEVLAAELSRSPDWMIEECERFQQLAARYQPSAPPLDLANPPP